MSTKMDIQDRHMICHPDAIDPGYIYIIRQGRRLKIGKSRNRLARLRAAKTWLPDGILIASKPFWHCKAVEWAIHQGLAHFWYKGEWFDFRGNQYERIFIREFKAFDDNDINRNSSIFAKLVYSSVGPMQPFSGARPGNP